MTSRVEGLAPYVTDSPQTAEALPTGHTLWTNRPFVNTDAKKDIFASLSRLRPGSWLVLNHGERLVRREVGLLIGRRTARGKCWPPPC